MHRFTDRGNPFRWPNFGRLAGALVLSLGVLGCQNTPPSVSNRILLSHLPQVDVSGLATAGRIDGVKVTCSAPTHWKASPLVGTPLYMYQQWKSPSQESGAGVVYARLPFPLSAKTLIWLAKLQYSKETTATRGQALGEWTDALGRPWFEAENEKYHVRGYAIVHDSDAWIVYYGYKVKFTPNPSELNVAARFVETVIPETHPVASHRITSASASY